MQQTMNVAPRIGHYLQQTGTTSMPTIEQIRARAALEFRQQRAVFEGMGLTEEQFVKSRLVDAFGYSPAPSLGRGADTRPAHERLPGLVVANPVGNQVGAR